MQPVKNKKMTYLLICAVAGVWGVILYRVFFNDAGDDYQLKSNVVATKHEPYDQYVSKEDTFKLALNYKDPFVGEISNEPAPIVIDPVAKQINFVPAPVKPPINWSSIKYSGYIVNPSTKKLVSIIVVNGRESMLDEGALFDGVKLLKNKRDSILVSWQGKQKYIKQ